MRHRNTKLFGSCLLHGTMVNTIKILLRAFVDVMVRARRRRVSKEIKEIPTF